MKRIACILLFFIGAFFNHAFTQNWYDSAHWNFHQIRDIPPPKLWDYVPAGSSKVVGDTLIQGKKFPRSRGRHVRGLHENHGGDVRK